MSLPVAIRVLDESTSDSGRDVEKHLQELQEDRSGTNVFLFMSVYFFQAVCDYF